MKLVALGIWYFCFLGANSFANTGSKLVNALNPTPDFSTLAVEEDNSDREFLQFLKHRKQMLNWHRYAAWTTLSLMAANLLLVEPDGNKDNLHKWLGIASGATYATAAGLAYFTPTSPDLKESAKIKLHKKLIWIHAPAFLLTIFAGLQADQQHQDGTPLGPIARLHPAFALVTFASFGIAALSTMDWAFSLIPLNKKEIACVFTKTF